jgi:hypothetical protein
VAQQERVEQRLVRVLQVAQEAVLVERRRLPRQRLPAPLDLLVDVADVRRQQAVEAEQVALPIRERSALVQTG